MSNGTDTLAIIRELGGNPQDLPFWEACREGRFLLHRCEICGRSYWPASLCVDHGARSMAWVESSGRGTLFTYTVMHHAYTAAMKGKTPYVVGVVKLLEGPFFHSNIAGCALDEVAIGMPLQATMITHENGLVGPLFRRA
jgi:uncharacterized OB-fold protein